MKAIQAESFGGPEKLKMRMLPRPVPGKGQVLVRIKAFGINRAELYMREGKWPEIADIIGIECVGLVEQDPEGHFRQGEKVACMMGGMGRSINGSYAEFTCVPASNVIRLDTALEWGELAAIPETFASAWGALHWGLGIRKEHTLLIRGATSAFGLAALLLARQMGVPVIATTRSQEKEGLLRRFGATHVKQDNDRLKEEIRKILPGGVDRVLDLVGSTTLMNSAKLMNRKGVVCMAGLLGGRTFMDRFQPLVERLLRKRGEKFGIILPGGVRIKFFASSVFGTRHFPMSRIPLYQIVKDIEEKRLPSIRVRTFPFEKIAEAHHLMESNEVNGKITVLVEPSDL